MEDSYLGDGVYASYDGFAIVLDLRAQDSTTRIALEPHVFTALAAYAKRVSDARALEQKCQTCGSTDCQVAH